MRRPLYSNLDHTRREIRLLTIRKDDDDVLIHCTTRTVSLNDVTKLNALSYCWGDPNVTSPVVVDGFGMNVTINLEDAMRQLRRSDAFEGEIWVDAICINQTDVAEKNEQVPRMKDIYSASKVFIWLGESDIHFDEFIIMMRRAAMTKFIDGCMGTNFSATKSKIPKDMVKLLCLSVTLVTRSWWQRVWTFQEFYLANEAVLMCGSHLCSVSEMAGWFAVLGWILLSTASEKTWTVEYSIGMRSMHPKLLEGDGVLFIGFMENIVAIADLLKARIRRGRLNLRDAMGMTRTRKATDPRDKIFALLGLISDSERADVPVDYEIETWKLYHQITPLWPGKDYFTGLKMWKLFNNPEIANAPSWILDFSKPHGTSDHWHRVDSQQRSWLANKGNVQQSQDQGILTFNATTLDTVHFTCQIIPSPIQNPQAFFEDLKKVFTTFNDASTSLVDSEQTYHSLNGLRTRATAWEVMIHPHLPDPPEPGIEEKSYTLTELNEAVLTLIHKPYAERLSALALERRTSQGGVTSFVGEEVLPRCRCERAAWEQYTIFRRFVRTCAHQSSGMFFFTTKAGFRGYSKMRIQIGDQMVIPHGANLPLVLRPHLEGLHRMVGFAFISGLENFAELEGYHKMGIFKDDEYNIV